MFSGNNSTIATTKSINSKNENEKVSDTSSSSDDSDDVSLLFAGLKLK